MPSASGTICSGSACLRQPATAAELVAAVRMWRMFPFDCSNYAFDSALLVRWALLVVIVGSVIGLIVNVIVLLKISFNPR